MRSSSRCSASVRVVVTARSTFPAPAAPPQRPGRRRRHRRGAVADARVATDVVRIARIVLCVLCVDVDVCVDGAGVCRRCEFPPNSTVQTKCVAHLFMIGRFEGLQSNFVLTVSSTEPCSARRAAVRDAWRFAMRRTGNTNGSVTDLQGARVALASRARDETRSSREREARGPARGLCVECGLSAYWRRRARARACASTDEGWCVFRLFTRS